MGVIICIGIIVLYCTVGFIVGIAVETATDTEGVFEIAMITWPILLLVLLLFGIMIRLHSLGEYIGVKWRNRHDK